MKKQTCPLCGEKTASHNEKRVRLNYKGHDFNYPQPGLWCSACNDGVIYAKDKKASQKIVQAFKANVDNLLEPDEIKHIRKKLKLTQRKASQLLGGGVNAFSRYEKGEIPIYRATSQLLRLLDKHPEQLQELLTDFDSNLVHA